MEAWQKILAGLLGAHFFVQAVFVPAFIPSRGAWGTALELSGTHDNLEIAAYVHAFLSETAARLWMRARREEASVSGRERARYLAGVMRGFAEQLSRTSESCAETGLVWKGDAELDDYVQRRHARLSRSRVKVAASIAWHRGRADGQQIVLHRGVASGTTDRGKLVMRRDP